MHISTDLNMTHISISANHYKKWGKHCRLLPATPCCLKISLPTNSSPAATVKPTTVVSNPGAALHKSSSSSQAMPSETLNILIYIRFSFGQMFFTSEAVHTHTQVETLKMLTAVTDDDNSVWYLVPTDFRKHCSTSTFTLPSSHCWCQTCLHSVHQ